MNRKSKRAMLTVAKHFFKQYIGRIDMTYNKIIPTTGEIGCVVRNYKDFKHELNHALKNGVVITKLSFETYTASSTN